MITFSHLKTTLLCSSVALLLTACGGSSKSEETIKTDPDPVITIDYQKVINETVSDIIPGIVLLVESPENKFLGSAGVENTTSQNPMQVYHTMPTASTGKPMIGLLSAILADKNLLKLDDTLDTWLTDDILNQIANSAEITLRQLLTHTSGIYDSGENDGIIEVLLTEPEKLKTDIDFLPLGLNQPATFKPGQGYAYSNTGYLLTGLILDKVLGMHHSVALREHILEPLGMESTYYRGIEKNNGDFISGYHKFDDVEETFDSKLYLENVARASDPVVSSVEDMALFIKSAVVDQSFINNNIRDSFLSSKGGYPLGVGIQRSGGYTMYSHAGLNYGYHTQNIYIKEKDLSITAFINCSTQPICENAMDSLIEKILDNEL